MNSIKRSIIILLALYMAACTWVDLSPQGEKVRVLEASEVTACERVGKTTVTTAAKVAVLERHDDKVESELSSLARNSAVNLGGDTVVAIGNPVDGRQVFEVYRCMPK